MASSADLPLVRPSVSLAVGIAREASRRLRRLGRRWKALASRRPSDPTTRPAAEGPPEAGGGEPAESRPRADRDRVRDLLTAGMATVERKAERRLVEDTIRRFRATPALVRESPLGDEAVLPEQLYFFLASRTMGQFREILDLRGRYAEYVKRYSRATTPEDAKRHILEFARDLGASPRQLRGDRKAFARWFGHEAVSERYSCRCALLERWIVFGLRRLGILAEKILGFAPSPSRAAVEWGRLGLESKLRPLFAHDGDRRVPTAALACLSRAVLGLPPGLRDRSIEQTTLQFIYRSAMHSRLDVWLQCEALVLLESLSPAALEKVLRYRLSKPAAGDDIFVRRRAVEVLGRTVEALGNDELFDVVAGDPSPFVRQALAAATWRAPAPISRRTFRKLALEDAVPQVRGFALREGLRLLEREDLRRDVLETIEEALLGEKDALVLRVAIEISAAAAARLLEVGDPDAPDWHARIVERLEALHVGAKEIPTRRQAAMARERLWCAGHPRAGALRSRLEACLATMSRGARQWLPEELIEPGDRDLVGRVLSVIAQADFPCYLEPGTGGARLTRGENFVFRSWRFLHELRNPSPDKRQAFRHTTGRRCPGTIRAPSAILAELAETRVPGEPLLIGEEGGWRPYLPILDDFVSSLGLGPGDGGTARIYTAEGITEIVPPASFRRRLAALVEISRKFPSLAKLRNWRRESQDHPASYLRALASLGFVVRHSPHVGADGTATTSDPEVTKFFPMLLPLFDHDLWGQLREYFFSVYGNSVLDLAVFGTAATGLFLGRHIWATRRVHEARRSVPLVIGGWGTRGKSGTERLKAAVMSGLGYGIVSKTTGCEAMFLFAHPFMPTREMFLFRSYDKATIWEQSHVLRLAARLGADVFLWECMALTPSYVEVLQRHWVRDDFSTITNTYPDHEDIQGPAGINVPEVISIFTPTRGRLVTTEEIMAPIVEEESRRQGTSLRKVTWMDSMLLAPDALRRFPYDEHPSNIALVLGLAAELGVPEDFALKEMADRVVPDLGVLKTYPEATIDGRRLTMANGMSANERHGTISNWLRCGFNVQDPYAEPGVWISTVVNNRADRVARSRVFAKCLVEDLSADRHFLIGGNLNGLQGYIRQAWEPWAANVSLWPKDSDRDSVSILTEMARRFRQPTETAHVLSWLRAMVPAARRGEAEGAGLESVLGDKEKVGEALRKLCSEPHLQQVAAQHEQNLQALEEYRSMVERIRTARPEERPAVDSEFRHLLWTWFERKIVVVEDYYISGEQLVKLIADRTPPQYLNRVMGIQNIKGTGLDFVYRWQAWDACHRACVAIESGESAAVERGLKALGAFHEYGVLSRERVARTLEAVKGQPVFQNEGFQAELAMIRANYDLAMKKLEEKLRGTKRKVSRLEKVLKHVEAFVDAGDAVRRRKLANRIYDDLVGRRISTERAVFELQQLNKRQKGGWLVEKVNAAKRGFLRNLQAIVGRDAT